MEFLRRDCQVMTKFFSNRGVTSALSVRELFDFVTDTNLDSDNVDAYLSKMQKKAQARADTEPTNEEIIEAGVFAAADIPRKLSEVPTYRIELEMSNDAKPLHSSVTGLKSDVPQILGEKGGDADGSATEETAHNTAPLSEKNTKDEEEENHGT